MEFVVVTFPTRRTVFVDGAAQGETGQVLRVQTGTHIFDLGEPANYTPPSQRIRVIGTSPANPLVVIFTPAGVATRVRAGGGRRSGKKAAKKTSRKGPAARVKKTASRRKKSRGPRKGSSL